MPNLRENLLIMKCLNTMVHDYRQAKKDEYHSAEIDFKLDFLSFLTSNKTEEVQYGIEYLQSLPEWDILFPIITEYQTYGLNGSLSCPPIPKKNEEEKEQSKTLVSQVVQVFKNLLTFTNGENEEEEENANS